MRHPETAPATPDGRPADEQPKWRQDFPIDWAQDEYVSRRDLVKFMVLTSTALAASVNCMSSTLARMVCVRSASTEMSRPAGTHCLRSGNTL